MKRNNKCAQSSRRGQVTPFHLRSFGPHFSQPRFSENDAARRLCIHANSGWILKTITEGLSPSMWFAELVPGCPIRGRRLKNAREERRRYGRDWEVRGLAPAVPDEGPSHA